MNSSKTATAEAYTVLGYIYEQMGDKAKALDDYRNSLQLKPSQTRVADRIKHISG